MSSSTPSSRIDPEGARWSTTTRWWREETSRDNEVATFDHRGRPIAMTKLPWRVVFFPRIDASGRVWVQVRGGNRDGYNLVLFDRRLRKLGTAVIRRFRDAFGDYVLSARPDELGVESLVLSRATR